VNFRLAPLHAAVLAFVSHSAFADTLVAKQLAGSPAEFAAMAPAPRVNAAIHSKSALIPFELDATGQASVALPIESENARFVLFGASDDWQVSMTRPGQRSAQAIELVATDQRAAELGIEQAGVAGTYYTLEGVERGTFQLHLNARGAAGQQGFLLLEGNAETQLVSYQAEGSRLLGSEVGVVASLANLSQGAEVASGGRLGSLSNARALLRSPSGREQELMLSDDGRSADGRAGDGVFGLRFSATEAGNYVVQVLAQGSDASGRAVVRSAEHVIAIAEQSVSIADATASASVNSSGRIEFAVPVRSSDFAQHYRGYAEVWGTSDSGRQIPVAWVGGMVTPEDGQVTFALDPRWAQLAGANAPYELRQLRLENPDNYVIESATDRMLVDARALPRLAANRSIAVDEAMLMGERPAALSVGRGVGTRLLLVHGYCSGGVWPTSNFSNASTFLDANQNRSHDEFARRIRDFGATWNSFGVVAHSQGGAASLHLYAYYWSGLDNATGSRLIQSVGTPYQGTNLAGVLAALGGIFGVGCGTNNDLTYSGASAWLSGVPSWARGKVNYYTTAFRSTNWWTNDYCNFASDLVLSDPEDGTVEQSKGQLSGATNRGHTTGQCHTDNMRDPAQYRDAARNSVLNTNAAR
jgi:hypothetical protein